MHMTVQLNGQVIMHAVNACEVDMHCMFVMVCPQLFTEEYELIAIPSVMPACSLIITLHSLYYLWFSIHNSYIATYPNPNLFT